MKKYTFICEDTENNSVAKHEFSTEHDAWSGYDGPAYAFFNFLKGCGFSFFSDSELGVMDHESGKWYGCYNE